MADKLRKKYRLSKIFKRAMALFIIVIINFNSYAAVVSSNDGSAFITKAEFDALVNDFNSRIEDYEKSIDAKIDGAIAEYLAGLATASSYIMEDLIHVAKVNSNNNLKFIRWKTPQAANNVDDVSAGFYITHSTGSVVLSNGIRGMAIMCNNVAWAGGLALIRYTNFTENSSNFTSYYYYAMFPFGVQDVTNKVYTGDVSNWYLQDINRYRVHYDLSVNGAQTKADVGGFEGTLTANHPTQVNCDFSSGVTALQPGSKTMTIVSNWLNRNWSALYTMTHSWTRQSDTSNNDFLNYNLASSISGNVSVVSYDFRDYYSPLENTELVIQRDASSSGNDGGKTGVTYNIHNYQNNSTGGKTDTLGFYQYNNNITFNWNFNKVKVYNVNWANLVNGFFTTYFNEPYYKYYGIPICKPNKMTGDITFKLKFSNTQVSGVYPAFTYQINDVKFSNGNLPSSGALYSETVPQGNSTYTKDIKITKDTIKDATNGDYLYIKIQPSVAGQIVSVDTEGDILITIEA